MRPWIVAFFGLVLGFFLLLYAFSYLYGRSLRHAGIIEARGLLKMAANDYEKLGYVTNYGGSYEVWLSTNVVTIQGTQYQIFLTARVAKFYGQGALALTTNQQFIWLDAERPPKVIGADYRPPLFPPRF